jgi:hypothetical protein
MEPLLPEPLLEADLEGVATCEVGAAPPPVLLERVGVAVTVWDTEVAAVLSSPHATSNAAEIKMAAQAQHRMSPYVLASEFGRIIRRRVVLMR